MDSRRKEEVKRRVAEEILRAPVIVERIDIGRVPAKWEQEPTSALGKLVHRLGLQPRPTRDSIILKCFGPVLEATTFQDLQQKCAEAAAQLRALDLHDSIQVAVDKIEEIDMKNPSDPIPCSVYVVTKEKQKASIGTTASASVSGREAGLEAHMTMNNYFGRAEKINYKYSLDVTKSSHYELSFQKPLLYHAGMPSVGANVVKESVNNTDHSSHRMDRLGLHGRYTSGEHELSYELSWREISLSDKPTQGMLEEGGHSVKSSIKHSWSRDTRNDGLIPTYGSAIRIANELAGLGGSVRFIKSELDLQHNIPLTPAADWSLNLLFKTGALVPFAGSRSHIADRFFLGGPGSFRGFNHKGLGPRFKRDSYGGDVFWAASAHLVGLLRDVEGMGLFYGHLFFQAGNNVRLNQWRQALIGGGPSAVSKPGSDAGIRTSMGAGIAWRMPVGARVELNYVWPLNAGPNDAQVPGPQVGMSVGFL